MQAERHELTVDAEALREQLRHVYWIGGGSGAGKSTIAHRIAAEHGLQLYATDDVMADHARRSTPGDCPLLHEFMTMDMDERWVNRSPREMLETFHWFRGEGFGMIIEDILRLFSEPGMIVEGLRLLPHLVKPLLAGRSQAVWLLPTPEFRQAVFDSRGGPQWRFIAKTSDPQRALRNLLERDAMFTQRLSEETQRLGLNMIEVDPKVTVDELAGRVAEAFGL
jgi:2-phosphoglycerate kinase